MKNKLLLSLVLVLFVGNCWGQVMFQKLISTPTACASSAVQQIRDSGYIIAGTTIDSLTYAFYDVYLIKINLQGDFLWTKTFQEGNYNQGISVQQTSDDGYIVAGNTSDSIHHQHFYVIKTNSDGDTLWTKAYGGAGQDFCSFIQQTNEGGYIITGITTSFGAGSYDVYLIKINANGDITWTKTYGAGGRDAGQCVRQTSDSGYIIVGYTDSFTTGNDEVYLIKTNVSGDTLWTKSYGGIQSVRGTSVEQTTDGGYIITGNIENLGDSGNNICLIKTNYLGDTLWTKIYIGTNDNYPSDVQQTNDSGYIICGSNTRSDNVFVDTYLIKTNSGGDTLWTRTYVLTYGSVGYSVRQTDDGGYIIAGSTGTSDLPSSGSMVYIIKTDANGNSGCNQINTNAIVVSAITQVASTNTIVGGGGTASPTNTIVGSGGTDSTLCLVNGINELSSSNSISLYPNPAASELRIKNAEFRIKNIVIYNVLGQEVQGNQYSIINDQYSINISSLASGLYFVRVAGQKDVYVGKFVKE